MWRRVDLFWTDVSEEHITSNLRVEKSNGDSVCSHLLTDFSTLKLETIRSSETSVQKRSTRRHIPEDGILHGHLRKKTQILH
jgi:hypothetical protein